MDSKGRIYDQVEEYPDGKVEARNMETGKYKTFPAHTKDRLKKIPEDQVEAVMSMNRKDRREWFKEHKI